MDDLNYMVDKEIFHFFESWKNKQMKVAMVIASVTEKFEQNEAVDFEFVAHRIYDLVEQGSLISFGNIRRWRFSEIRPSPNHS